MLQRIETYLGLVVTASVLFLNGTAQGADWHLEPPSNNIRIVKVGRGIRWQSTRTTAAWFPFMSEALIDGGPLGIGIAILGFPLVAAVLPVAASIDIITIPFRTKTVFDMEFFGKLFCGGEPVSNEPIIMRAEAWRSLDIVAYKSLNFSTMTSSDKDGFVKAKLKTSFGPQKRFEVKLERPRGQPGDIIKWEMRNAGKGRIEVEYVPTRPCEFRD